jgi:heme/copper-type cytochrome/quinol oxidase subunit 1
VRLKQSPYHLLLLTGLVLVLISFFLDQSKTVDIHVHDTYYVIAQGHVFIFFAFIVLVLWFLYLLTKKFLYSKSLTWTHVIITLFPLLFLLFLLNFGSDIINPRPRCYLDYSNWNKFNAYNRDMRWISYITIALLLGQIIFIVNLIIGIVKRMI